mmetsp:Transcript_33320/g.43963  ORF Transcript_33320/g.43963 Transcript_33320/m.43963 type:complete len:83 (-) Transcript_33320:27-275(-)
MIFFKVMKYACPLFAAILNTHWFLLSLMQTKGEVSQIIHMTRMSSHVHFLEYGELSQDICLLAAKLLISLLISCLLCMMWSK